MFLTLIMAMIEYATIFYSYGVMHDAARDVVRRVAVNATSVAAAEDAVLARLPAWSRDATSVTIDQTVPDTPGVNIISIRVSADASAATVLPWLTRVSDFEIATQAEMRQELPFEELEP
jgi:Flp pilus assembly protein TadG